MSTRFTKSHSNYTLRTLHQRTDLGPISERDWVTTNSLNVLRFGAGRKIWYNSGNFVFTTSNVPSYHKRHKLTTETEEWDWYDCKDADGTVNEVKPNLNTNDIRSFAYYGSCSELIRATIEEIITDFPGRLNSTTNQLQVKNGDGYKTIDGFIVSNDFNIDLHHKNVRLGKYDNPMRFMSNSWDKYCIKINNKIEDVTKYEIGDWKGDLDCPRNDEGKNVIDVTFNGKYTFKGYSINSKIIYVYEGKSEIIVQPKQEVIDAYFASLKGFKGKLLRQDSKPLYTNKFITPEEHNFVWFYPERLYIWPSDDYCIDINSMAFTNFTNSLIEMALKFDELWTDNIYRSMTHEAIKNFDWTYSREYYEGEEQDYIDGGERMGKILRVFGRVFDDVKLYIDTIGKSFNITYDNIDNCSEALFSDAANEKGIEVVSTISSKYDTNQVITKDFLDSNAITKDFLDSKHEKYISKHKKWYPTRNSTDIFSDICDNEMMRRLTLSLKYIMKSKGTQNAIDMLMGLFGFGSDDVDYTMSEEAYYTKKLIPYNQCADGDGVGDNWTTDKKIVWTDLNSRVKGDLINEANAMKDLDWLYYEDPYSGVPLRTILTGYDNVPYIVPYYDQNVVYDGNLMFQGKGGWGKTKDDDDDKLSYQETLSYLHVSFNIEELLSVNVNDVKNGDIYYVTNLSNYTEYDETPPMGNDNMTISHYFVLVNEYAPYKFSSWQNIVLKQDGKKVEKSDFQRFFGNTWDFVNYSKAYEKMVYLENIFSTNIGNNPHVGYGEYDDGKEYLEYMKKPFKYSLDNHLFNGQTFESLADKVVFDDITDNKVNDKIQIFGEWLSYDKDKCENVPCTIKIYNDNIDLNEDGKIWYINTKVFTITNNKKTEESYKNYFKEVIMPYIMQIIPSTTILKLIDF